jgi:hypothetical protein
MDSLPARAAQGLLTRFYLLAACDTLGRDPGAHSIPRSTQASDGTNQMPLQSLVFGITRPRHRFRERLSRDGQHLPTDTLLQPHTAYFANSAPNVALANTFPCSEMSGVWSPKDPQLRADAASARPAHNLESDCIIDLILRRLATRLSLLICFSSASWSRAPVIRQQN